MIKKVYDNLYSATIHLVHNEDNKKAIKYCNKEAKEDLSQNFVDRIPKRSAYMIDVSPYHYFIITGKHTRLSSFVHECLHVCCRVFRTRGLPLSEESEEAYTYYLSWMIEQFFETFTRKIKC